MAGMTSDAGSGALPSLAPHTWLVRPETQAVLGALAAAGHEGRIVGGAVRNALLGVPVKDIDIATAARPDTVVDIAERAGLRAIATGIEHGTVTVVANHIPYEVTTLRRDIETFGRHARVTFTSDWAEDARRRDFTINALYCAADGTLHDPLGGYPDIVARRVRYIGEAADRIREDFLRILRFYRFTAEYTSGEPDPEGHAASMRLADGLNTLSAERVRAELLRLLAAPAAELTVTIMSECGLLAKVLPGTTDLRAFERLAAIEQSLERAPDSVLRLAALAAPRPGAALELKSRLRLSSVEYERIARGAMPDPAFDPSHGEHEAKAFIYRHGAGTFADGALIAWARSDAQPADRRWRSRVELASRWTAPELPVRGADVLALGVPAGREVGRILSQLEDWWIASDFTADAQRISSELQRLSKITKS